MGFHRHSQNKHFSYIVRRGNRACRKVSVKIPNNNKNYLIKHKENIRFFINVSSKIRTCEIQKLKFIHSDCAFKNFFKKIANNIAYIFKYVLKIAKKGLKAGVLATMLINGTACQQPNGGSETELNGGSIPGGNGGTEQGGTEQENNGYVYDETSRTAQNLINEYNQQFDVFVNAVKHDKQGVTNDGLLDTVNELSKSKSLQDQSSVTLKDIINQQYQNNAKIFAHIDRGTNWNTKTEEGYPFENFWKNYEILALKDYRTYLPDDLYQEYPSFEDDGITDYDTKLANIGEYESKNQALLTPIAETLGVSRETLEEGVKLARITEKTYSFRDMNQGNFEKTGKNIVYHPPSGMYQGTYRSKSEFENKVDSELEKLFYLYLSSNEMEM